jgi:hypothetical protein
VVRLLHPLVVAARRHATVRRAEPEDAGLDPEALRRAAARWSAAPLRHGLREVALFELPASTPPWLDTGLDLVPGEAVTWIAAGRTWLSRPLDVWLGPQLQVWARVGEAGPVFNGTRETHGFTAERPGRLYLASYLPGQWADPTGRLAGSRKVYRTVSGGTTLLLLRWRGHALPGLRALAAADDPDAILGREVERLERSVEPPPGWHPLWFVGRSEIFRAAPEHGGIRCETCRDVGILQREAPFEVGPGTRLRWRWRVDALPSALPEDTRLSHDYLSVAVELHDGRDITYTWSCELPEETAYWCPLPGWSDRELHVVVRSGPQRLGEWIDEERDLHVDLMRHLGMARARVSRVWLIAVSLFQRRPGRCEYARIRLEREGEALDVLG